MTFGTTVSDSSNHKRRPWWHDWLAWVLLGSVGFNLLCLINLATDVGRPYPGFLTYHNFIIGRLDIVRNTPAWWWRADESPRITDILKSVNGVPFDGLTTPLNEGPIYESAWQTGERQVAIVVERDGRLHELQTPLQPFSWADYWDFTFAPAVLAAGLSLLAFILYRAAGHARTQRLPILILVSMSILPLANHPSLFQHDQFLDRVLSNHNHVTSLATALVGVMLVHFATLFPYPLRRAHTGPWRWVVGGLYTLALLTPLLFFASRFVIATQGITLIARRLDEAAFKLMLGLLGLGAFVLAARVLLVALGRHSSQRHRREAQLFLVGLIGMLPVIWLVVHPLFGSAEEVLILSILADSRFFALALAFAFAAVSLRYHTFRGAERWLLFTLLFTVSGYLANAGAALLFASNPQAARLSSIPPTAILFVLLFTVGLLWSWQTSWRGWLGRVLNWEQVNYRAVQAFSQHVLTAPADDLSRLTETITAALKEVLGVTWAAVWQPQVGELQPTTAAGAIATQSMTSIITPERLPPSPIRLDHATPVWLLGLPPGAVVALPLVTADELLGLIVLGRREDTTVFDDRDLEILALVAQQATIFLKNGQQSAELRRRDQDMVNIQKETQQKIAQDLHDYVLPLMSRLQLQLLTGSRLLSDSPERAAQEIEGSIDDVRQSAALIRRLQKQLVLPPLEYSLAAYLHELVQRFRQDTGIIVDCSLPDDVDQRLTEPEIREVIYAVWRQALDNIRHHAGASHVSASMAISSGNITFSIGDNGRGCSADQRQQAIVAGRFGLRSMRMRLEAVGGHFTFTSQPAQGTTVRGVIPLTSVERSVPS